MVTKVLSGSYNLPKKSYSISLEDYMDENEEMISDSQIRTLRNLIFQKCDENERERWLANIQNMTKIDAEDAIFDFLKSSCS